MYFNLFIMLELNMIFINCLEGGGCRQQPFAFGGVNQNGVAARPQ